MNNFISYVKVTEVNTNQTIFEFSSTKGLNLIVEDNEKTLSIFQYILDIVNVEKKFPDSFHLTQGLELEIVFKKDSINIHYKAYIGEDGFLSERIVDVNTVEVYYDTVDKLLLDTSGGWALIDRLEKEVYNDFNPNLSVLAQLKPESKSRLAWLANNLKKCYISDSSVRLNQNSQEYNDFLEKIKKIKEHKLHKTMERILRDHFEEFQDFEIVDNSLSVITQDNVKIPFEEISDNLYDVIITLTDIFTLGMTNLIIFNDPCPNWDDSIWYAILKEIETLSEQHQTIVLY